MSTSHVATSRYLEIHKLYKPLLKLVSTVGNIYHLNSQISTKTSEIFHAIVIRNDYFTIQNDHCMIVRVTAMNLDFARFHLS